MDKKLPSIFEGTNISSNNKKFYYSESSDNEIKTNKSEEDFINKHNLSDTIKNNNINSKIINIFKHSNSIYKIKVLIETDSKKEEKYLIGRTNSALITIDGETINISDIKDINMIE